MSGPPVTRRYAKWKEQVLMLYFGLTDPQTPFYARIPAIISLIYLISPIDLIPDFIPFAGWLDDLVIVPLLLGLSFRLLPAGVREASRKKTKKQIGRLNLLMVVLIIILILILIAIILLLKRIFAS